MSSPGPAFEIEGEATHQFKLLFSLAVECRLREQHSEGAFGPWWQRRLLPKPIVDGGSQPACPDR
eukprot:15473793-Alexandrium_andersonii.AAC.2